MHTNVDEDRGKFSITFIYPYETSIINIPLCFGSLLPGSLRIFSLLFWFIWAFFKCKWQHYFYSVHVFNLVHTLKLLPSENLNNEFMLKYL